MAQIGAWTLAVICLVRWYIHHRRHPWQDVAVEIDEPRVHSSCSLMGRWRYVDDGSEEDDFVLEFFEAMTGCRLSFFPGKLRLRF